MNLIILGPQGSGKGTQAKLLVEKWGLFYLEVGQILRDLSKGKTPLGEQIASFINKGELVPNQIMVDVLKTFLTALDRVSSIVKASIDRSNEHPKFISWHKMRDSLAFFQFHT